MCHLLCEVQTSHETGSLTSIHQTYRRFITELLTRAKYQNIAILPVILQE